MKTGCISSLTMSALLSLSGCFPGLRAALTPSQLLAWLSCIAGMLFLKTWELVLVSQQFQLVPRASLKLFWGLCSKTLQAIFKVEITGRLSPLALTGLHWGAVTPDIWSWVSSQAQLLRSSTAVAVQTQNFPCYVFPGLAPAVS